jgi:general secretion pathway protein H
MTWRAEHASQSTAPAGFTLIELLVVMTILGLALALVSERGPMRSATLDSKAAMAGLAGGLREARSQAIALNQPVAVTLDIAAHDWRIGDLPPHSLPPTLAISLVTTKAAVRDAQNGGIVFEPDGSSTGGRIELSDDRRKLAITVDWLTGNVTTSYAR